MPKEAALIDPVFKSGVWCCRMGQLEIFYLMIFAKGLKAFKATLNKVGDHFLKL
jgi:hypothetical protein